MTKIPPIPPGSPHFSTHDYQDGKGLVVVFWASTPFWSYDHGEPWRLEIENCPLDYMARLTVAAVARCLWIDEGNKHLHTLDQFKRRDTEQARNEALANAQEWKEWGEHK